MMLQYLGIKEDIMSASPTDPSWQIQVDEQGRVSLPKAWLERHAIEIGDTLLLLDIVGTSVLLPGRSEVDTFADRIRVGLESNGATLEGMLRELRTVRDRAGDA